MKSINFAYWLQGWFEIDRVFDFRSDYEEAELRRWADLVSAHLDMVFIEDPAPSKLCLWMQGFLAAGEPTEEGLKKVAARLADEFTHVIDPMASPDKKQALDEAHNQPLTVVDIPPLKPDQAAYIAAAVAKPPVDMSTVVGGPTTAPVSDDEHKVVTWSIPRRILVEVEQRAFDEKLSVDQTVIKLLQTGLYPNGRPRC